MDNVDKKDEKPMNKIGTKKEKNGQTKKATIPTPVRDE